MSKEHPAELNLELLRSIITEFYEKAFADGIIGHFFFNKNHQELLEKQILFTANMLKIPSPPYKGQTLKDAHKPFFINNAHFGRRRVILQEVMEKHNLSKQNQELWLKLEDRLKGQVTS